MHDWPFHRIHDWPFQADDWIPSPELVAVWAKLGMIPSERVPLWAAHWLVAGHDGEHAVYTDLARMHLDGRVGALWVCKQVDQLLSGFEFVGSLMSLPLSELYDVDCEWDGGWGRTVEQLALFVRETCEEQVRRGSAIA